MIFYIYIFGFSLIASGFFLYLKLKIKQVKKNNSKKYKHGWKLTIINNERNVGNLFMFFLILTFFLWGGITLYQMKYADEMLMEAEKILLENK
jgi:hypothetical protein